jgi:hypothetical protein
VVSLQHVLQAVVPSGSHLDSFGVGLLMLWSLVAAADVVLDAGGPRGSSAESKL